MIPSKVRLLDQEITDIEDGQVVLLETSAENAVEVGLSAMRIMTTKKATAIFLSASRPCTNILTLYKKNGISTDHLLILDCVCKNPPISIKDLPNIIHLEDVSALTSISLAITEGIRNISGKKFVFIDSISTMLIHNQPPIFGRFIHSLLTKLRLLGVGGILLSLEVETDKMVRAEIAQLCDKVIKV